MEDHLKLIYSQPYLNPTYPINNNMKLIISETSKTTPNTRTTTRTTTITTTTATTRTTTSTSTTTTTTTTTMTNTTINYPSASYHFDLSKILILLALLLLFFCLSFFASDRMMKFIVHLRLRYKRKKNEQSLTVGYSQMSVPTVSSFVAHSQRDQAGMVQNSPTFTLQQQTLSQQPTHFMQQQQTLNQQPPLGSNLSKETQTEKNLSALFAELDSYLRQPSDNSKRNTLVLKP
jgi:hypothetical protein